MWDCGWAVVAAEWHCIGEGGDLGSAQIYHDVYKGEKKGSQFLLSYSQAGPGRKAKWGQGRNISQPHTKTFSRLCIYNLDPIF